MDVTTTITNYLGYVDSDSLSYGKSFIVKSQSGYYFPCRYAFISGTDEPLLNFVKGLKYKNEQVGCTQINILTEEPTFDINILWNYKIPQEPFIDWEDSETTPV